MKWIKCGDRQPEVEYQPGFQSRFLIYAPRYPEQIVGVWRPHNETWTFQGTNSDFTDAITHWMPLPEPPQ
jgi:hypothetical protein